MLIPLSESLDQTQESTGARAGKGGAPKQQPEVGKILFNMIINEVGEPSGAYLWCGTPLSQNSQGYQ